MGVKTLAQKPDSTPPSPPVNQSPGLTLSSKISFSCQLYKVDAIASQKETLP